MVSFVSVGTPRTQINIIITPNDGTNNGSTAVNLTTAELVELINNGSVTGKNVTITDSSGVRTFQTATGEIAQILPMVAKVTVKEGLSQEAPILEIILETAYGGTREHYAMIQDCHREILLLTQTEC